MLTSVLSLLNMLTPARFYGSVRDNVLGSVCTTGHSLTSLSLAADKQMKQQTCIAIAHTIE